ncbi:hypothetical protein M433DRAFT_77754 [Acidomyces richmondensis BFW]|nr:MAG: hypothetical protein FE78DRAFT_148240 [Acidomyces sp. 'richmondensis']KYG40545.1 hypothetical protein M433DRAFT_77754 [Acidomyces richmondensis BFW]
MPFRPQHSLLRVEERALHTIDTSSVENLYGMWSLFSKASHALEEGRRLENLSWRLWNRETFCCTAQSQVRPARTSGCASATKSNTATTDMAAVPELSSSVESVDDLETASAPGAGHAATRIPKARPELRRFDSTSSNNAFREKHITPVDLQELVISIKENKSLEPIELPAKIGEAPPTLHLESADEPASQEDDDHTTHPSASASHSPLLESSASTVGTIESTYTADTMVGSEGSSNTEMSTHSIVRGFVPGGAPSSYRSQTHLSGAQPTPILKTSPTYQQLQPKKKGATFTIGTSSGEDESSLDSHMAKSSFKSSLSERLRSSNIGGSGDDKKQTSFKEEVSIGRAAASQDSPVFDSEDEEDEVSESAIEDDDDSSDWEDSDDQSGPSSVNEKDLFQRVDSRPNLTSRRSLLTTLMHEPDRAKALQNAASRSTPMLRRQRTTPPNGPSVPGSPEPGVSVAMSGQDVTRSKPIIMTTSNTHPPQVALSPRTTRRNMLSTELTESLRKNLLWERQHRSTGNLAALKRRHTAQDMSKLRQYPEPISLSQQNGIKLNNDYFNAGLQEYHAKGW